MRSCVLTPHPHKTGKQPKKKKNKNKKGSCEISHHGNADRLCLLGHSGPEAAEDGQIMSTFSQECDSMVQPPGSIVPARGLWAGVRLIC